MEQEYSPFKKAQFESSREKSDEELLEGGAHPDPENVHHLLLTDEQVETMKKRHRSDIAPHVNLDQEPLIQQAERIGYAEGNWQDIKVQLLSMLENPARTTETLRVLISISWSMGETWYAQLREIKHKYPQDEKLELDFLAAQRLYLTLNEDYRASENMADLEEADIIAREIIRLDEELIGIRHQYS